MERNPESQGNYWSQPSYGVSQVDTTMPTADCHGEDSEEPLTDNLLDRSGLFDELVCQILDEGQPNIEAKVNTLNEQRNQPAEAGVGKNFQALKITTSSEDVPTSWAKTKVEMIHETQVLPKFPPGINEKPIHPASFDVTYQDIPPSNSQVGVRPAAHLEDHPLGKQTLDYFKASQFMKGDHIQAQPNFLERSLPNKLPGSGGDGINSALSLPRGQNVPPAVCGFNQRGRMLGYGGIQENQRGSPVPEDPHQYFRQRAAALQQAQQLIREQFPVRHPSNPGPLFPNNKPQQTFNAHFPQNPDLIRAHLMQMNLANNWPNFNKHFTKGNPNLSTMGFDANHFSRNNPNVGFGQSKLPKYQFSMHRMPSSHQGAMPGPTLGQPPTNQFQQHRHMFNAGPDVYNQFAHQHGMTAWPQTQQQGPLQSDNQSYLSQLHVQLESCYYQFYTIEKERKKTEIELSRMNPGRRISSANTIQTPQLPDNPTSLDRMIVDFYKEHSRVYTLMSKIGGLCAEALHPNIDACLDSWIEAIQETGARRRDELRRVQDGKAQTAAEQRGYILVEVIEKLANATRRIRTALWCALQMSKENKMLENEEDGLPLLD